VSLNPSQQRAVAVALRQLEERLSRVEDIIGRDESGVLFSRPRPKWSSEEAGLAAAMLARLRTAIASVAETYGLPAEEGDPGREIAGLMRVSWESLAEIDSRRLRSYGRVDPGLRTSLDPTLEQMMALVAEIEELAVGHGAEDDPRSV